MDIARKLASGCWAVLVGAFLYSCGSGEKEEPFFPLPTLHGTMEISADPADTWLEAEVGGATGHFTTTVLHGGEDDAILWEFGGGAAPNSVSIPVAEPGPYTVTVEFVDVEEETFFLARCNDTSRQQQMLYCVGPEGYSAAVPLTATYDPGLNTIQVTRSASADSVAAQTNLEWKLEVDAGFTTSDVGTKAVTTSEGDLTTDTPVQVLVLPADPLAGASGDARITVRHSWSPLEQGSRFSRSRELEGPVIDVEVPPLVLAQDTLYAIPARTVARVGEPVRVDVITGEIPADKPFWSMRCQVAYPAAGHLSSARINDLPATVYNVDFGAPFRSSDIADGLWARHGTLGETRGAYLANRSDWARKLEGLLADGRRGFRYEVILDQEYTDLTGPGGHLFNFTLQFDEPGTYHIGFADDTKGWPTSYSSRPTYVDGVPHGSADRQWSDITNEHAGVPGTIFVSE